MKLLFKERRKFNVFLAYAFAVLFIVSLIFLNYYNEMKRTVFKNVKTQTRGMSFRTR